MCEDCRMKAATIAALRAKQSYTETLLRRIHKGERVDDGLNFWRGLLIGLPASFALWAVIFAAIRWAI